ncbi:hypothetical protein F2P56_004131 [Juglans regia]|uniref:Uncharacterized protein n=1 Tax=Juglans regia TaxID=51240 RepID=A0A833Y4V8_JUGRE|nr:hypothetical protein F2P56_004131 [Juglans regia]
MADGVRFKKQQENLLLIKSMEQILEAIQHLRNLVDRTHNNYKVFKHQLKESFGEWQDQVAEEDVKNATKVEDIVAVPTGVYPKEIPLFPLHTQPLIPNSRIILPNGKNRICHIRIHKHHQILKSHVYNYHFLLPHKYIPKDLIPFFPFYAPLLSREPL